MHIVFDISALFLSFSVLILQDCFWHNIFWHYFSKHCDRQTIWLAILCLQSYRICQLCCWRIQLTRMCDCNLFELWLFIVQVKVERGKVITWLSLNILQKIQFFIVIKNFVSWCFEPSQPQGLNTNFTLSPSYSFHRWSYHKSCFFYPIFIFFGHSTQEPASGRVTYVILRAYTGTMC